MNDSYRRALAALPAAALALVAFAATVHAQAPAPGAPTTPAPSTPASTPPAETPPPSKAPAGDNGAPPATPGTPGASAGAPAGTLDAFDWLQGCWHGNVNQRDFREHWLPAGGGMMIGAGHTVLQGRTQDYEYLRLETRPDGLYYVALPSGQKEAVFRLSGTQRDAVSGADIWTFTNTTEGFPQRIVYRRGGEGWLYASAEGALNGEDRKVTYPMRHVSCESGEALHK